MLLQPKNRDELCSALQAASASRERIEQVDLSRLNRLVEYHPEDMTATVEAGMTLTNFQRLLAKSRQWLPIDPPFSEKASIGQVLASNLSGPRRFGFGTIRDYLIGIRVAMTNGDLIQAGGKVVKNVAGYDLCKLFIGAENSLGIIAEATFKLRPLPELERLVTFQIPNFDELEIFRSRVMNSRLDPILFDAHNSGTDTSGAITGVLGFSGAAEDVEHQLKLARELGPCQESKPELADFWSMPEPVKKFSVLPAKTTEFLRQVFPEAFVAHLGNGIVYTRHPGMPPQNSGQPMHLLKRLKEGFDPLGLLPDLPI